MASLFTPLTLKTITLKNRIAVSPMCQYLADDGVINDWHQVHLATLAHGGASLVIAEATAVSPEGRITPGCAGIWTDHQGQAWARAAAAIKAAGAVPGIQLAHAGRKASANRPWEGDDHIAAGDPRGWETIAPSAVAFGANLPKVPRAMTLADIERVKADFVGAARRACEAGFEWLELHFAHGYLAQNFLSTWSNQRHDAYGGGFDGRSRFLVETLSAVRDIWPDRLPLTARVGVTEFDGSRDVEESIELARRLKAVGVDLIDVSVGFSTPTAKIPWGPALMAPIAERVRREADVPTATSWFISEPTVAEALIAEGKVDLVELGRPLLENPRWPYRAARELGVERAAWTLPAPYAYWLERYRAA
ncbi:MAG TPA: NADH:flavin oxidoreductase/NADH oxidase [Caulobacteraceae bacterium]|nr:NADH:flavin oxidoreductase/NADH oxidase [Caulobacteraceae bacterium]